MKSDDETRHLQRKRHQRTPVGAPALGGSLRRVFAADPAFADWRSARTQRIQGGFYTSQALELARG
jgi:hypothetical protein